MVNKTILYGFLTADPEVRHTKTGKTICSLRIAHKENYKDDSKDPIYISVDVWDKQGETCAKVLKKGSSVIVDGRLSSDSYQNKEGQKVTKTFIVADKVSFVPRFEKSEKTTASAPSSAKAPAPKKIAANVDEEEPSTGGEGEEGDDIPF
jgi:single-strand DNA-binding protein